MKSASIKNVENFVFSFYVSEFSTKISSQNGGHSLETLKVYDLPRGDSKKGKTSKLFLYFFFRSSLSGLGHLVFEIGLIPRFWELPKKISPGVWVLPRRRK